MSVQECVRDVRKIADDADGDSMPAIRARIDIFEKEMRRVPGLRGKDEMHNLMLDLENAAQSNVRSAASHLLEKAATHAGKIWSSWGLR